MFGCENNTTQRSTRIMEILQIPFDRTIGIAIATAVAAYTAANDYDVKDERLYITTTDSGSMSRCLICFIFIFIFVFPFY